MPYIVYTFLPPATAKSARMPESNPSDLVPLEIAVRCIFSAIYDDAPTHERLTGLAQALVALVPVYQSAPPLHLVHVA